MFFCFTGFFPSKYHFANGGDGQQPINIIYKKETSQLSPPGYVAHRPSSTPTPSSPSHMPVVPCKGGEGCVCLGVGPSQTHHGYMPDSGSEASETLEDTLTQRHTLEEGQLGLEMLQRFTEKNHPKSSPSLFIIVMMPSRQRNTHGQETEPASSHFRGKKTEAQTPR